MKTILLCVWISAMLLLGCAVQPSPDRATAIAPERESKDPINDNYPSKRINAFVTALYQVLEAQDQQKFAALWDAASFIRRVTTSSLLPLNTIGQVKSELTNSPLALSQITNKLLTHAQGNQIILLETNLAAHTVKFRFSNNQGSTFVSYILEPTPDGYKIIDLIDHSLGLMLSEKTAFLYALAFSSNLWDMDAARKLFKAIELFQQNQSREALALIGQISPQVLKEKAVIGIYLEIAASIDQEAIKSGLELLKRFHGEDPRTAFLLSGLYLLNNDLPSAIDALKESLTVVGPDAGIHSTIAEDYLALDEIELAISHANEAIRIDPTQQKAYWVLALAFVKNDEAKEALLAFDVLKTSFGYTFDKNYFYQDRNFAALLAQPEFRAWLDQL